MLSGGASVWQTFVRPRGRVLGRIVLPIVSFLAYAASALLLHQGDRNGSFNLERTPVAAAVSNIIFGARRGRFYEGIRKPLLNVSVPANESLQAILDGKASPGALVDSSDAGLGVGFTLVTTLGMRLFGIDFSSIVLTFLTLMGLSASAFMLRFPDDRSVFVPVTFFALTAMMFTPLVTRGDFASQIPVGGFRYFSLLGIIPATHIFLDMLEHPTLDPAGPAKRSLLLLFQAALLVVICAVSLVTLYLVAPILLALLYALWTHRRDRAALHTIFAKARSATLMAIVLIAGLYAGMPHAYKQTGRGSEVIWHRVVISLGANPSWPFGNLRDVYATCEQDLPEGLIAGIVDRNGHCIWVAYGKQHGIRPAVISGEQYGGRYEAAMRSAFFDIARSYPLQTLETFVVYKPRMIVATLSQIMRFDISELAPADVGLLVVEFVSLMAFGCFCMSGYPPRTIRWIVAEIVICIPCACGLYLIAWSIPYTSSEILFFIFALFAVALVSLACFLGPIARTS